MAVWQTIDTAPKDGTWIIGYGMAYPAFAERGDSWVSHNDGTPRIPFVYMIRWVEGWYDKEIKVSDGLYRKEATLSYAYWGPGSHAFLPTHWMRIPEPPR